MAQQYHCGGARSWRPTATTPPVYFYINSRLLFSEQTTKTRHAPSPAPDPTPPPAAPADPPNPIPPEDKGKTEKSKPDEVSKLDEKTQV